MKEVKVNGKIQKSSFKSNIGKSHRNDFANINRRKKMNMMTMRKKAVTLTTKKKRTLATVSQKAELTLTHKTHQIKVPQMMTAKTSLMFQRAMHTKAPMIPLLVKLLPTFRIKENLIA